MKQVVRTRRELPEDQDRLFVRLSKKDKRRIEFLAKQYAGGNVSQWVVHGALTGERKFLVKDAK